jgi:hypothetical protein
MVPVLPTGGIPSQKGASHGVVESQDTGTLPVGPVGGQVAKPGLNIQERPNCYCDPATGTEELVLRPLHGTWASLGRQSEGPHEGLCILRGRVV